MTRRWSLRLLAGALAGVALLSGCAQKQQANESLPSASASPTEEELPPLGPEDLPMPAEARKKTPEGAIEFMRYYMDLSAYISSGPLDPAPLLDLSANCSHCERVAESFNDDRTEGYRYEGFTHEFREYGPGVLSGDTAEVGFVYAQSSFDVYNTDGQLVPERSADATGDLQCGAFLRWDEGRQTWLVTSLTIG